MTVAMFPWRSASFGLLFGCVLLVSLASLQAAAQDDKTSCMDADLKGYAELGFCLPPEVAVNPEAVTVANYSEGREVRASMLFNESKVFLHLLYPCPAPKALLEPAELRSRLEAFAPVMGSANYSSSELNITGMPALWGQVENTVFAAYQPANRTIAFLLMDGRMNETVMASFLSSLMIAINESKSPLPPGFCGEPEATEPEAPESVNALTNNSLLSNNPLTESNALTQNNPLTKNNLLTSNNPPTNDNPLVDNNTTPAEARQSKFESGKARMAADMEAAKERLAAAKENIRGF